jgi:hypothetical protein
MLIFFFYFLLLDKIFAFFLLNRRFSKQFENVFLEFLADRSPMNGKFFFHYNEPVCVEAIFKAGHGRTNI